MDEKRWKVGELAAGAGLTVRALHHWDELELLALQEVRDALEGGADLRELVQRQLSELEERIELERRLHERLVRVLEATTSSELMATIEVMTMIEKHYTPQQLATLEQRRAALGPEGMAKAQDDWAELVAAVEREYVAGTDPAEPRVRELAARWQGMVEQFTGGDPGTANRSTECTARRGWRRPPGEWSSPS